MCIGQSDTIYSSMCLKICCVFHGHYFSLFDLFGQNQYCLSVAQWGNQPNVHFTLNTQHSLLPLSNSYYTQAFTAIPFGIPYYTPPFTVTIEQFLLHSSIHCYTIEHFLLHSSIHSYLSEQFLLHSTIHCYLSEFPTTLQHLLLPLSNSYYTPTFTATFRNSLLHSSIYCYH